MLNLITKPLTNIFIYIFSKEAWTIVLHFVCKIPQPIS